MTNKNTLQPPQDEESDIPVETLEQQFRTLIATYLLNPPGELVKDLSSTFPPPGYDITVSSERTRLHDDLNQDQAVLEQLKVLLMSV